jgi:beta-lactamase regulating signal transducer with metallopeptidase domain
MTPLVTDAVVQAIGWSLLHLVWQGALVATLLAALLALVPGRWSNVRYTLSCLALLLVVALGIDTGIRSYRPSKPAQASLGLVARPAAAVTLVAAPSAPLRSDRLREIVLAANAALPRIVSIWLAGVLLLSARLMLGWLQVRRLRTRQASPAPEPWPSVARRLARALHIRHVVQVLESAVVDVPSVVGFVRPAILIPASTFTGLSPAQLEMILAHELAHIRRHDFLVNLLQAVVETLLFYHPAVWWISRRIRIERENCCDDLAIETCGSRLEYARALVRLDELRTAPALAMSATGGSLFERVRRLSRTPMGTAGPAVRALGALTVQLCVLAAIAVPSLTAVGRSADARPRKVADHPVATPNVNLRPLVSLTTPVPSTNEETDVTAEPTNDPADPAPEADPAEEGAEPEKPTVDDLIALRVHDVSAEDIAEFRSLLPALRYRDIAGMKAVGVTPDFIREMRRAGLAVESPSEASGLAALGVTRSFVREMRSVGFPVLSAREAQSLKAVGVTAAYVRAMRSIGFVLTPQEAQGMSALGVTPEYVEEMRDAGVEVAGPKDAQSLRALGISADFVRRLARAGYRRLTVEELTRLGAGGVSGDFVREMSRYRTR